MLPLRKDQLGATLTRWFWRLFWFVSLPATLLLCALVGLLLLGVFNSLPFDLVVALVVIGLPVIMFLVAAAGDFYV